MFKDSKYLENEQPSIIRSRQSVGEVSVPQGYPKVSNDQEQVQSEQNSIHRNMEGVRIVPAQDPFKIVLWKVQGVPQTNESVKIIFDQTRDLNSNELFIGKFHLVKYT